jgi:hypothetical protein
VHPEKEVDDTDLKKNNALTSQHEQGMVLIELEQRSPKNTEVHDQIEVNKTDNATKT